MPSVVSIASAAVLLLVASAGLSLSWAQTLTVSSALGGNFESPTGLSNGNYQYNVPTSVLQPWTWSASMGGIASAGSAFDPPYPSPDNAPPSMAQYAFLRTSADGLPGYRVCNMSATLSGLSAGTSYNASFYYAARSQGNAANATQSQLTLCLNGQQLWQSVPAIIDLSGWASASGVWTASGSSGQLLFQVVSTNDDDHSVLVDSVLVVPTASPLLTTGSTGINSIVALSFGSPPLNGSYYGAGVSLQSYWYNPPISGQQPWSWTRYQGGIAITGSPFDPPPPVLPPSAGRQYAFIQVSPNNALDAQNSNMSTTLTGLTANSPYVLTFYTAIRSGFSLYSSLTLYVNNAVVYYSQFPVTDSSGWQLAASSSFTVTGATASLVFALQEQTQSNSDGVLLITAISVGPPSILSSSTAAAAAGVSSSAAVSSSPVVSSSSSSAAAAGHSRNPSSSSSPQAAALSSSAPAAVSSAQTGPSSSSSSAAEVLVAVTSSSSSSSSGAVAGGGGGGGGSGLSGGAIAGIFIGSVVGAMLLCLLRFFLVCSRSQGKQTQTLQEGYGHTARGSFNVLEESQQSHDDTHDTDNDGVEMADA